MDVGWALAYQETGFLPLLMPVISPKGALRGHVLRVQKESGAKEVKSYKIVDEPWQCWYYHHDTDVVVVEDQISALKASSYCTAVALLGTELSQAKFEEILRVSKGRRIWLALDKDATKKGFEYLKRYRIFTDKLFLLMLNKDIKNMSDKELMDLGGPFSG
jgi:hypothetical protein